MSHGNPDAPRGGHLVRAKPCRKCGQHRVRNRIGGTYCDNCGDQTNDVAPESASRIVAQALATRKSGG